jgi:hypothetical protein
VVLHAEPDRFERFADGAALGLAEPGRLGQRERRRQTDRRLARGDSLVAAEVGCFAAAEHATFGAHGRDHARVRDGEARDLALVGRDAAEGAVARRAKVHDEVADLVRARDLAVLHAIGAEGVDDGERVREHGVAHLGPRNVGHRFGEQGWRSEGHLVAEDFAPRRAGKRSHAQEVGQVLRAGAQLGG